MGLSSSALIRPPLSTSKPRKSDAQTHAIRALVEEVCYQAGRSQSWANCAEERKSASFF
jgi:hypothetical protein